MCDALSTMCDENSVALQLGPCVAIVGDGVGVGLDMEFLGVLQWMDMDDTIVSSSSSSCDVESTSMDAYALVIVAFVVFSVDCSLEEKS